MVGVLALANGARAAAGAAYGAELLPDTSLYTVGGVGLFPSPLGRLLGAGGYWTLAVANVVAATAAVLLVAAIARELGGSPALAAAVALVTPLMWWSMFVSVDSVGCALVLAALYALLRGRERPALTLACAGIAAHLAVAPLVVAGVIASRGVSPRARAGLVAVLALGVAAVAVLTPYGGNAAGLLQPDRVLVVGAATLGIAALPFLPFAARVVSSHGARAQLLAWAAGTFVAAGVVGAADRSSNARYALPLVMLLAVAASVPRRRLVMA